MTYKLSYFLSFFISLVSISVMCAQVELVDLKVEGLENPIGIDVLQPRLSWSLKSAENNVQQGTYQILVASSKDKLTESEADLWNSGLVESSQTHNIIYQGKQLKSKDDAFWKVTSTTLNNGSAHATGLWKVGILNYAEWKSTRWIGKDTLFPEENANKFSQLAARYLRTEFPVDKTIRDAHLNIMGLGLYEAYINGEKIGNQVLAPIPTDYTQNVKYNVFDVTKQLKSGDNAIGIVLGNGRYFAMRQNYKLYKIKTFGYPKLAMQLIINYNDGSQTIVKTDDTWKITGNGPIRANNEYDGETYDATKEMSGWSSVGFDDNQWLNVSYVQEPRGSIEAQMTPNMKIMDSLQPKSIKRLNDSTYIMDMGQNFAGWVEMTVKGNRGHQVKLKFAETLQDDGSLYLANLRDAQVTDTYVLKGGEEEKWEPTFVYHGFRFVEISNYPGIPKLSDFVGKVVYDDIETTGTFTCSNEVMNQVFHNAYWGILSNYKGMPIDCPQRNERQPWLGDRTTGAYGESFLFDNETLYAKWLDDIEYAQTSDGGLPDVAPAFWRYYGDNVTWPGTYFTVADMLYMQYGNKQSAIEHYPSMKKWIGYMEANYLKDGLITKDKYGDWCVPPESKELIHSKDPSRQTEGMLISSAFYVHLLDLMQKFATFDESFKEDITYYQKLSEQIKSAFNKKYLDTNTNNYDNGTVTANLMAIAFDIAPKAIQKKVFENIEKAIEVEYKGHISTGVIGTQLLMRTLSDYGRSDLAYKLASNDTYPSWGYMAKNGATTIWELWNGNTADPSMNSQNHVMLLGDLLIWYYENMAGIKTSAEHPGFKQLIMKPEFNAGLDYVDASYKSIYGRIKSHWKKKGNTMEWVIEIPANTSAKVYLQASDLSKVKVNKTSLKEAGVATNSEDNDLAIQLNSGKYLFTYRL